ncbi:hypothetical protein HII36_16510 [Nonomuraea sp. NN258]|uniref:hypothetical protein n=1 Tax=Nonomuraea antri TaxID=2730852 RepID=UPI00156959AD|nr:hypothetical protein [Nonomuraea antri]NRQ33437.1 hypothetical protein [Nonomuraea antri]
MSAPRLFSCVLALSVLTVGACSVSTPPAAPAGGSATVRGSAGGEGSETGTGTDTSADPGADPSADPAVSPTGSPNPGVLTAEAYKGELDTRYKTMLAAINALAGARNVRMLNQRVERAEEALSGAADALAALAPPVEVRTQHDAYVASLRSFATELGSTVGKVAEQDLCTSSAVLSDLGDQLKTLDEAGESLQGAGDYPADVVEVKAAGKKTRRLGNGAFIRRSTLNGRSSLQIHNGGSRDAVVTVVKGGSKAFSVYVRKKSKFRVRGVRDGSYKIYFTHGVDWDGKTRAFTRQCSFERFQKTVKFKTTYTATQILWHDWRITLHSISGGNARTANVDPEKFPS